MCVCVLVHVCVQVEKVFAVSKMMKTLKEHAIVCDNVHLCVADTEVRNKSASLCVCVRVRRSEGHADRVRS